MLGLGFKFFQNLLNRSLKFDPRAENWLQNLQGNRVLLVVNDLQIHCLIVFSEKGIRLQKIDKASQAGQIGKAMQETGDQEIADETHPINLKISAPLATYLTILKNKQINEAIQEGLCIEGDMAIATEIQHFVTELDIDWEEILSRYTGDMLAQQFFKFFKGVKRRQTSLVESVTLSAGEFLQEERRILPTSHEVDSFNQAVDELRDQVQRLEAKLELAAAKNGEKTT